jgi:hypothetical protein
MAWRVFSLWSAWRAGGVVFGAGKRHLRLTVAHTIDSTPVSFELSVVLICFLTRS